MTNTFFLVGDGRFCLHHFEVGTTVNYMKLEGAFLVHFHSTHFSGGVVNMERQIHSFGLSGM